MDTRQKLLTLIKQLPDEQLSVMLNTAVKLKRKNIIRDVFPLNTQQFESQAYQDWVNTENEIYDKIFADAITER